ncbi:transcriptional repressor AgaR [Erythrobacter sp. LQ02-29]|uniref:transcriptional repressor AgaR n=1 Tax=unclassified Erythrobacter TaxID=2633097 RepID=UPI001BFC2710|nr:MULTISPECIES: transcriptional repressor AgaR [unclassified Erythrobacter]MCP9222610.1 transcriptional repressor AgaR [Erythrobacter sp. LQ02-29]QWC56131.1 DeoR family transcriptional regulator [Erythrobacter sp. 3-20A1M]
MTKLRDTSGRRQKMIAMLKDLGSIQVAELSRQFDVSSQTIRKDLDFLCERGLAERSYGGAISTDVINAGGEPAVETKQVINVEEKRRIGKCAADMVVAGDSIVLDSGTTAMAIATHLPDIEDITVVTNDFNVLSILARKEHVVTVMLGGQMRRRNMAFYGGQTMDALDALHVDKLFLGVDGFDLQRGLTTHYEPEAVLNRKMVGRARSVIAVTDSSKFGRTCLHRIIDVGEISALVTDTDAPDYIRDAARTVGFDLYEA